MSSSQTFVDISALDRPELPAAKIPLYVDLDGTLLKSDMLWETALEELLARPWSIPTLVREAFRGRAAFKRYLALRRGIRPETLPYNEPFLAWLEIERMGGRRLILATASDEVIAKTIADHLGIFQEFVASDGVINLKGARKLALMQARENGPFGYAGNSRSDLSIWEYCQEAIPVSAAKSVSAEVRKACKVPIEFSRRSRSVRVWSKLVRSHQWSKNLLVFVPVLTSHRIFDRGALLPALEMAVSLSLAASATYIFNDLHDLASDRQHPRKRLRPLASGDVSIPEGIAVAGLLGVTGFGLAALSGMPAVLMLASYVLISAAYSLHLKKKLLVDVFTLSGLYTLRIIAGGIVTSIMLSGWLLSFSVFLFLSLGFSKRAAEIRAFQRPGKTNLAGRAYRRSDFLQINQFGVVSGFTSSLVLALYVGSDQVVRLYREPAWLWMLVPLFLFWISRLWLLAYRGELNEDPVVFALTDRGTLYVGALCLVFGVLAVAGVHVGFIK